MSYNLNDFEKEEYGILEDGEYEVTIDKIEIKISKNQKEYVNLTYRVRDDIDQKHQNRLVFDTIFKEKDSDYFNRKRLTKIVKAVFPQNTPMEFENIDDIFKEVVKQKIIIGLKHSYNDYMEKDQNYVAYFKPTKNPDKDLTNAEKFVEDEACPF